MFYDPDFVDPAHRTLLHPAVRAEALKIMVPDKESRRTLHSLHIQLFSLSVDIFSFKYVLLIPRLHIISVSLGSR